jgi:hypothetical protein
MRLIPTSITHKTVDPSDPTGGATLDALMLRQKQLQQQKPEVPAQIASPWQGAALMANTFVNGLQQNAAEDQEKAGRNLFAQTIAGINPETGATPDQTAQLMKLDPDTGMKYIADAMATRRANAEYARTRADQIADMNTKHDWETAKVGDYKTSDISSLRQDVISDPSYKNMAQATPIWTSIQDASTRDTPQSDLNIVIGMAKLFDPTSVVRQSETGAVELTGDLPSSLMAQWKYLSAQPGSRLAPEVRAGLLREGQSRMAGYSDAYKQKADFYRQVAIRHGVDPLDVVPDFAMPPPKQEDPNKPPAPTVTPAPNEPPVPGGPTTPPGPQAGPPMPVPDDDLTQLKAGQTYIDKTGNVATYKGGDPKIGQSWTIVSTAPGGG